jgi:CelD/BcsL family acetyltransferase involved in cellulose biosynthesis
VTIASKTDLEVHPVSSSTGGVSASGLRAHSEWGTADLIDQIAEEWRQLCQEGPCNMPFYRPEWIAAAVRAFAAKQRILLLTVRDGSRLRAVLPLVEQKGRAGVRLQSANIIPRFEFVHGDMPGAGPGDRPDLAEVLRAAWQHLRSLPGWDVIELINVPQGGAAEQFFAVAKDDGFPAYCYEYARSPYIPLDGQKPGGDFSRFGRSSRFRYHLRQGWRELSKQAPLRLRRLEKADPAALQFFYRLEQSGWKGRKGTAIGCSKEMQQFYDSVARAAEQFGYLSMYLLDHGDRTIAAHLAFTHAGRYYPVKVAYDESFHVFGPGHLIIGRVLEDCVARGLIEFDCLGDWTDAKSKWAEAIRPHSFCGIYRNTALGYALRAEAQLRREAKRTALRILGPAVHAARAYMTKRNRRSAKSSPGKPGGSDETKDQEKDQGKVHNKGHVRGHKKDHNKEGDAKD